MSGKVIIAGGTVLSLDRTVGNLRAADVLIEDGIIAEVGSSLRARNADVIDASHSIVMPGFVDTHNHVWHSLFRNVGSGPAPITPAAIGPHYTSDHVYAATLAGLLGASEAGITTVVDWADVSTEPAYLEAVLQAHTDSGLRTVLTVSGPEWDSGDPDPAAIGGLVEGGLGPNRALAFGARPGDSGAWEAARRHGLHIHAHAGSEPGSQGVVAELGQAGRLGEDVTLVHCTNLDERDLDAIVSSGAKVSLSPSMEMTDGFGWPPLQALIDRGIRPGLGVGSVMEAPGDIFAQMRLANAVQHARLFDLKLAGKGGVPNLLSTRDVIRYATIDGAVAVGVGDVTGSLAPGKQADILVLRGDRPNIAPINDPIGAVVWGVDTSNIDWVFVAGRALVHHGEPTADVARARNLAIGAHREVAAAAGLLVDDETRPS